MPTLPAALAAAIAAAMSSRVFSRSILPAIAMPLRARGRVIADIDAGLDAVENRRRDGEIACRREAVGHRADVMVDAENLLDDDDAALRPRPAAPRATLSVRSRPPPSD